MYICFMYWCVFCKKYSHHGLSPLMLELWCDNHKLIRQYSRSSYCNRSVVLFSFLAFLQVCEKAFPFVLIFFSFFFRPFTLYTCFLTTTFATKLCRTSFKLGICIVLTAKMCAKDWRNDDYAWEVLPVPSGTAAPKKNRNRRHRLCAEPGTHHWRFHFQRADS